jgi:hypothetical protein
LKEEALDRTMWRNRFGRGFGPVVRILNEWMFWGPTDPGGGSIVPRRQRGSNLRHWPRVSRCIYRVPASFSHSVGHIGGYRSKNVTTIHHCACLPATVRPVCMWRRTVGPCHVSRASLSWRNVMCQYEIAGWLSACSSYWLYLPLPTCYKAVYFIHTLYLLGHGSQNKQRLFTNSINRLVVSLKTRCVVCETGTDFLNIIWLVYRNEVLMMDLK